MRSKHRKVELSVEFIPLPPEREMAWWNAMQLIWMQINEERSPWTGGLRSDEGTGMDGSVLSGLECSTSLEV